MRVTAFIILALVLLSAAARAQNEDTRDLPSPSSAGRSSPPPESDAPRERTRTDRAAPRRAACGAEWVCGRTRLRANDGYPLGSNLQGLQVGGRWIDGTCRKEKRC